MNKNYWGYANSSYSWNLEYFPNDFLNLSILSCNFFIIGLLSGPSAIFLIDSIIDAIVANVGKSLILLGYFCSNPFNIRL